MSVNTSNSPIEPSKSTKTFKIKRKIKKLTVADFFCGCGGFSEGFHQAGYDVVFSLDNWALAKETHDINHPDCNCVLMDILKIKTEDIDTLIPDVDVIIGSPPCVSFSNSNNSGKANKSLGIQLINQFLKIILYKKTKPNSKLKYWIMENVPQSLNYVKDSYTAVELGLDESLPNLDIVNKHILVASDYGSPQGRKRAIVGDYVIPIKTHLENKIFVKDIFNMLGPPINNTHHTIKDILFDFEIDKTNLTDHFYDSKIPEELWRKAKQLKVDHGFMGKMQFPDSTNRLSRTIMATESYNSREAMIFESEDGNGYRAPTIREISSLMGFPINYQFKGNHSNKHKQIGNAVCVQLSYALAIAILKNDKITTRKKTQRKTIKLDCEQKTPLFQNYVEKPKKINNKYCRHIPYLKINQCRVELDNIKSNLKDKLLNKDINLLNMTWSSSIHKGTGSKALKDSISNTNLETILNPTMIDTIKIKLNEAFNGTIYDAKLFQLKNCRLNDEDEHLSPEEALDKIKTILDATILDDSDIETDLIFGKRCSYSPKILYGLYCVNSIVNMIH